MWIEFPNNAIHGGWQHMDGISKLGNEAWIFHAGHLKQQCSSHSTIIITSSYVFPILYKTDYQLMHYKDHKCQFSCNDNHFLGYFSNKISKSRNYALLKCLYIRYNLELCQRISHKIRLQKILWLYINVQRTGNRKVLNQTDVHFMYRFIILCTTKRKINKYGSKEYKLEARADQKNEIELVPTNAVNGK